MDKEMQRALALDGEKLRQLTGEYHGPWFPCKTCDGWGHFEFATGTEGDCEACNGTGWIEQHAQA